MKKVIINAALLLSVTAIHADERVFIHQTDGISLGVSRQDIGGISIEENGEVVSLVFDNQNIGTFNAAGIDSITFADMSRKVYVEFDDVKTRVINPHAYEGIDVSLNGADVIVVSSVSDEVEYVLRGKSTDGSFKLYSDKKYKLTLDGVDITNKDGAAINIQSGKKGTVTLNEGSVNRLADGAVYNTVAGEDMKATFFSEGQLVFTGGGALNVVSYGRHGICSDDYIIFESGNITVENAASDAIHVNDYIRIDGGNINVNAASDGLDAGEGYFEMNGGELYVTVAGADQKGIKADSIVTFNGGKVTMKITGDQSKGIKSKHNIFINSGEFDFNLSGKAVIVDKDPSYCTAIKGDAAINISGGDIKIVHTGLASKGISADGDLTISAGNIDIVTSGAGSTYTNTSNVKDAYAATCIRCDGDMNILGGEIKVSSSGTAGKGITCGGNMVIGSQESSPVINAGTTGALIAVSGSGMNASNSNPKAIKATGNLTVNNGNLTLTTSKNGGEGLESKKTLTINGGNLDINTYDDCINASTSIVINGGYIYCYSSGNDGIDSNGTITINGGVTISSGTTSPEEGFDCDSNTFKITGGVMVGMGGATSNPTTSVCTQNVLKYSGVSVTKDMLMNIQDAAGNEVITFTVPRAMSSMVILLSTPNLKTGASYTVYKNGSVSGGSDFHGYYTGATYTAGTSLTTFSVSSVLTTIGSTSGGGGGGGRPW